MSFAKVGPHPPSPRTTVVNLRRGEKFDVFIGRPGRWGNPFVVGRDGTRAEVIAKYRRLFYGSDEMKNRASKELRGKKLGCFCKPSACHGDVLAEYMNGSGD